MNNYIKVPSELWMNYEWMNEVMNEGMNEWMNEWMKKNLESAKAPKI
jgi:hypothetical protein